MGARGLRNKAHEHQQARENTLGNPEAMARHGRGRTTVALGALSSRPASTGGRLRHLRIDWHDSQDRVEAVYTPTRRQQSSGQYGEDRRLWYSIVQRSHP